MNNDLFHLIENFPDLNVLVIGEAMLDSYFIGNSTRISREAPVPVVVVEDKMDVAGGAANTAVNIHSLGGHPLFLSVIGDDPEGKTLRKAIRSIGISTDWMIVDRERRTLAKQRIIAASQMMLRFDQGNTDPISAEVETELIENLISAYNLVEAVIISDYGYGIITPNVIKTLANLQKKIPKLILVDSKDLEAFKPINPIVVKPNFGETVKLLNIDVEKVTGSRIELVLGQQKNILHRTSAQIAAVTLDEDGALIFEKGQPPYRTYAKPVSHTRATGAGDTFISAFALALAAGAQTPAAAEIASAAASVVVNKDGTSACYAEELRGYFSGDEKFVTDIFQLAARIAAYRTQGKKIIFTNGCFDILHRGHITYLNQAKDFGDVLVVGLNSDASVRRLKGNSRPINPVEDRGQVLAALSCVDHIIPFEDDTPSDLIRMIQPDIYVKGGDYSLDTLPEAQLVQSFGGEVQILPFVEDHSTSRVIERIRKLDTLTEKDPFQE